MDAPLELPRLAPGVHLEADPHPLPRARQLAEELAGRLCTTAKEADALLDDLSALPPLDADALSVLTALAAKVQAAERIVGRTVDRAAEAVGERLAATGMGVAVHPASVRDRAAAVLSAREVAAAAEERLRHAEQEADHARAVAALVPAPEPLEPAPVATEARAPASQGRRRWLTFRRRRARAADTSESTALLQQMAATTDEAFGQRRAASALDDQLILLRAKRDRALEEVRVAERSWRDLAGDSPVEDVEAVVRRFDPHHQDALALAQEAVGVRAVSALLSLALSQWAEGWRTLGFADPPVEPTELDALVAAHATAVVLTGDAIDRAAAIARAAPGVPVVAVKAGQSPRRAERSAS